MKIKIMCILFFSFTASADSVGRLEGLKPEQISTVIKAHNQNLSHCYNEFLKKNPGDRPRDIVFEYKIQPNGKISKCGIKTESAKDPGLDACLVKVFCGLEYPEAKAATEVEEYPIKLKAIK